MANTNCNHPAYRDSLQKCLVVTGTSRLQFSKDAGVSRETLREYLDENSEPYERTMHKILVAMGKRGWIDHPVEMIEQIEIEGKKFTASELKDLIRKAY